MAVRVVLSGFDSKPQYYILHKYGDHIAIGKVDGVAEWEFHLHELEAALQAIKVEAEWKVRNLPLGSSLIGR